MVIVGFGWPASGAAAAGQGGADAWWVWLPSRAEARLLASGFQPGERIYWHTATLTWSGNQWRDTERPEPPPSPAPAAAGTDGAGRGPELVPVLRLQSAGAVEVDAAWPPVLERLKEMRERSGADWVQLDCDCPDRLLPLYARRLQDLRRGLAPDGKLSVTALAGWAPLLKPDQWKTAADELTPMFYDLEPDRPDEILSARARPLVEPEVCARWLPAWQALGIPWRCGLANFRRLSRFKADGSALGHFPDWNPAALLDSGTELGPMEKTGPGAWRWKVMENVRLSGARGAQAGDWLVFREPDLSTLAELEAAALAAGARGVVWFARPTGRVTDGWSVAQLENRRATGSAMDQTVLSDPADPPRRAAGGAKLSRQGRTFTLSAGPDADLPATVSGGFGWVLELRGEGAAAWETSGAGQFVSVSAATGARDVGLDWRFAGLPAGASLRSAAVYLPGGPAASGAGLRWRVRPLGAGKAEDVKINHLFPWRKLP